MAARLRPQFERFLQEVAKGGEVRESARRAGFSEKWAKTSSYALLRNNAAYVAFLRTQVSREAAKAIAIELEPVLQEIAAIAFANEADYLVHERQGDKIVTRRKALHELTRQQMIAVRVFRRPNGKLDYTLRNKEARLIDLFKHLGGLNEKLILEHRHAHLHAHIDLSHVPLDKLEAMEQQLAALLPKRGSDV